MPAATDNPTARIALEQARAAWQRGDLATAEAQSRRALELGLDDARTWTLLGCALRGRDETAAEAAFVRAIELDATDPDAHFQLGNLRRLQGKADSAIAHYRHVLALAPGNTSVLNNIALALDAKGDADGAVETWRDVLRREAGHRQASANLAHALTRIGDTRGAAALCAAHVARFADAEVSVWVDQGICLHRLQDLEGAERSFRRALGLAPDDAVALVNLGSVLIEAKRFESAQDMLTRAVARDDAQLYALTLLAYCRQQLCQWEGLAGLHADILSRVANSADSNARANPLAVLAMPFPAAAQLEIARRWARAMSPRKPVSVPPRIPRAAGSRLRLGYVSSDFRTHPTAALMTEVWERHDRSRFETRAYSIGPRETSPLRTRIERAFEHFADCSGDSAAETARRIGSDGIDVLIDLNGYTTLARSEIFALRPAPVQISWLGYLGSMGAGFIDYVITDRVSTPETAQNDFDERLLALPHSYCPSDTRRTIAPDAPSRPQCGLPAEGFVFCCFNASYKILPDSFDAWMHILAGTPGGVLWLAPGNAAAAANLRREAARRDVDPARLVFAPHVPPPQHLARHANADLFLDTLHYNAGATANDALFAAVPLLTCPGTTMSGRVAASQLLAIGLPELVAADLDAYIATARRLATCPGELGELRARLRANRSTEPLFDMARFTRDLEDALIRVAPK